MSDGFKDADKLRNSWNRGPSDHYSQRVHSALTLLAFAINDPGPNPQHHYEIMRKHRAEWPALWAAIDNLLKL